MSVCVQPVELPGGDRTWTVLGADHRQVGPVEEFLEYHRVTGSSPHTVRGLCQGAAAVVAVPGAGRPRLGRG